MEKQRTKAMLAAFSGNAIFGFSFLASKVALEIVEPMVLVAGRFLLAFAVLGLLWACRLVKLRLKGKKIWNLVLLGVFQPILYFIFESYGIAYTSSSVSGVMIALVPIAAFLFGSFFLKERFEQGQFMWAVVSVAGVCVLSLCGNSGNRITAKGIGFLLGAVVSGAIFTVLSRSCSEEFSALERTFVMFFMGAIVFNGVAFVQTKGRLFLILAKEFQNPRFLIPVGYLAVLSSVGAFFLINYAVGYLPVRQATSFTSMTSVISVGAGVLFLHETLGIAHLIGIIMILLGVYRVNQYQ